MIIANDYQYKVCWSAEDQQYIGLCEEMPSLSFLSDKYNDTMNGIKILVENIIIDMERNNEIIPTPFKTIITLKDLVISKNGIVSGKNFMLDYVVPILIKHGKVTIDLRNCDLCTNFLNGCFSWVNNNQFIIDNINILCDNQGIKDEINFYMTGIK